MGAEAGHEIILLRIFTTFTKPYQTHMATSHSSQQDFLVNAAAVLAGVAAALLVKASFAPPAEPDATDHLLRDPRNAARLMAAVQRFRRGEYETHPLAQAPQAAA